MEQEKIPFEMNNVTMKDTWQQLQVGLRNEKKKKKRKKDFICGLVVSKVTKLWIIIEMWVEYGAGEASPAPTPNLLQV